MSVIKTLKGKGRVKNHSSKALWVVESDTNHPHGPAIAHLLKPNHKSPLNIDADGFKRYDGKAINGHRFWWKIIGHTTADVYNSGNDLRIDIIYKKAVPDNEFGNVKFDNSENWGSPIKKVVDAKLGEKRVIQKYLLNDNRWVSKEEAISLAENDIISNAVVVRPKNGNPFIRSKPDKIKTNNFKQLAKS